MCRGGGGDKQEEVGEIRRTKTLRQEDLAPAVPAIADIIGIKTTGSIVAGYAPTGNEKRAVIGYSGDDKQNEDGEFRRTATLQNASFTLSLP